MNRRNFIHAALAGTVAALVGTRPKELPGYVCHDRSWPDTSTSSTPYHYPVIYGRPDRYLKHAPPRGLDDE